MYRHVMAAALATAAFASAPAFAADLPAYEPAPAVAAPVPSFTWTGPYIGVQAGYAWGSAGKKSPQGFVGGGYAGYNYQFNSPLVLGVETDFNYSDANDASGGVKFRQNWNGATRARIGYAFDRFLVYGAGGVAYAGSKLSGVGASNSKTNVGWTIGGGVEYALTNNLLTRVDYRYSNYGSDAYGGGRSVSYDEHRVMAGVAYKF